MSYIDFHNNLLNDTNDKYIIPENQNSVDLIISKFNENLSYINDFKNVYIYDKGPINNEQFYRYIKSDVKYYHLKNVGRESHTYLYHIINNYDNLNDINIFINGSCIFENKAKLEIYNKLVYIYNKTRNTVFFKNPIPIFYFFKNVKMTHHITHTKCNNVFNDKHELKQYNGTYGDWYIENFGNIDVYCGSYLGNLLLHKNDILKHPKEYYQKLLKYLDDDSSPETGHYFERAWGAVFHPIDEKCMFNYLDVRDIQL